MPKKKMSEVELAKKMIEYFDGYPFEIFQEVPLYGKFIDIVIKSDKIIHCIECKIGLGFEVIAQADYRKSFSHYVSVCVPAETKKKERYERHRYTDNGKDYKVTKTSGRKMAIKYLQYLGIGLYEYNPVFDTVEEKLVPKLFRKALSGTIIENLLEGQKTFALAGSAGVKRLTPFRNTVINLENYVKRHPGTSYSNAVENIDTHYHKVSTAKSALLTWIQKGIIKNIRIEKDGRKLSLYYEDNDPTPSQ